MCIMAAVPPSLKLDKETFDRCWDKNPDGFGMSYLWNGKIRTKKTMNKVDAWNIYRGVCQHTTDSWMLLHFRIGTHGTKDLTNCHPFHVNEDLVFAHNGIIRQIPDCPDKLLNDTQMFNNLILKHLPTDFYKHWHFQALIEEYIGFSKLVFMTSNNEVYIFNESKGEWYEGVWFSNTSYKEFKYNSNVGNHYYNGVKQESKTTNTSSGGNLKLLKGGATHKSVEEMTDAEWEEYAASNFRTDYKQCSECCTWSASGKTVKQIGFICKDCIKYIEDELKLQVNDDLTEDDIINSMFFTTGYTVTEDDKEDKDKDDTQMYYGGEWMSYDEYMRRYGNYYGTYS